VRRAIGLPDDLDRIPLIQYSTQEGHTRSGRGVALNAAAQNQSWRELLVAGERQCEFSDVRWSQGLEYSTSGRPPVSLPCSDALSPAI
jgi:hypothetical protein